MIKDLNASYAKELKKLNFFKFTLFMMTLKIVNSIQANKIAAEYYLILKPGKPCKQFIENFFEFLYNTA